MRLGMNRLLFALFSSSLRTISELLGLRVINFTEALSLRREIIKALCE